VILWEAAEKRRPSTITMAEHGGLQIGRSRYPARSPHLHPSRTARDKKSLAGALVPLLEQSVRCNQRSARRHTSRRPKGSIGNSGGKCR